MQGLAERLGISSTPLYERFPTLTDLAIAMWKDELRDVLVHRLGVQVANAVRDPDTHLRVLIGDSSATDRRAVAALDLLIESAFDSEVRAIVDPDLGIRIRSEWAQIAGQDSTTTTQCAYLALACTGLMALQGRALERPIDLHQQTERLLGALRHPVDPTAHEEAQLTEPHISVPPTGDERLDRLFLAVLEEVGTVGYRRATIARITRRADVSRGFLTGRFSDKASLFEAASAHRHAAAFAMNSESYTQFAAHYSTGVAEAAMTRALLRIGGASRMLACEQQRRAWHEPSLQRHLIKAEEEHASEAWPQTLPQDVSPDADQEHWDFALGMGVAILPLALEGLDILRYEVVTVPMLDR